MNRASHVAQSLSNVIYENHRVPRKGGVVRGSACRPGEDGGYTVSVFGDNSRRRWFKVWTRVAFDSVYVVSQVPWSCQTKQHHDENTNPYPAPRNPPPPSSSSIPPTPNSHPPLRPLHRRPHPPHHSHKPHPHNMERHPLRLAPRRFLTMAETTVPTHTSHSASGASKYPRPKMSPGHAGYPGSGVCGRG